VFLNMSINQFSILGLAETNTEWELIGGISHNTFKKMSQGV